MRIDGSIACSSCQILVVTIGNVDSGARIAVLLRQSKVNDEQLVAVAANAHQEIVGFYVLKWNLMLECK